MERSSMVGKVVKMEIGHRAVIGEIVEWTPEFMVLHKKIENTDVVVPNSSLGPFVEVKDFRPMVILACKDEKAVCKGIRMLSLDLQPESWPCPHYKEFNCEIRSLGEFDKLPTELCVACLNKMHSPVPVQANGGKDGKRT